MCLVWKLQVIEQSKKLTLVNVELHEMRLKLSKTTQMERKIAELENALLLAYATSGQEVSLIDQVLCLMMARNTKQLSFNVSAG